MDLLFLLACAPGPVDDSGDPADPKPVDAEALLVELAAFHTDALFHGIEDIVEADGGSLYDMEPGDRRQGEQEFVGLSSQGPWEVSYREDDELRIWDWYIMLTLLELELESAQVTGTAAWTVESVVWDLHYANHSWDGGLLLDGEEDVGELVAITWTAYFSGNLHRVDGAVGGEVVSWANPDPDLP